MDKTGVIYILTNPSFPEYVKIGYADDIDKRLMQLNRSLPVFADFLYTGLLRQSAHFLSAHIRLPVYWDIIAQTTGK